MTGTYAYNLKSAIALNPSFKAICNYNIEQFPLNGYSNYYHKLNRGKAIPVTDEECNAYLVCYGDSHYLKMYESYRRLFINEFKKETNFEIFDWGGGQALASGVLLDYIKHNNIGATINNITLIEPSTPNINRGKVHLDCLVFDKKTLLKFVIKKCEDVLEKEISVSNSSIKIHLFSNILDMEINSEHIAEIIKTKSKGENYFVCVSPCGFHNILTFSQYFNEIEIQSKNTNSFLGQVYRASSRKIITDTIFRNELIFKTNLN